MQLIAAPTKGAHHLFEHRRIVVSRSPGAIARAVLHSQSGSERIAEFGEEQPEVSEEGVLAIDDPAQNCGMPFGWQAF
jgi:hypothetical protein